MKTLQLNLVVLKSSNLPQKHIASIPMTRIKDNRLCKLTPLTLINTRTPNSNTKACSLSNRAVGAAVEILTAVNSKNLDLNKKLPLKFQINLVDNKTSIFLVDKTMATALVLTKLNLLANNEKKYLAKSVLKHQHKNNQIGLKMSTLLTMVVILLSNRSDKLNRNTRLKFKKNQVLYCGRPLMQDKNQANSMHQHTNSSTLHHAMQLLISTNTHNLLNMKCMKCRKRINSNTTINTRSPNNSTLVAKYSSSSFRVKLNRLLRITGSANVLSLAKTLALLLV